MSIIPSDIKFILSGGSTNTNPLASIGGARSTVAGGYIVSGTLNNLWQDVDNTESSSGSTKYRCIYVRNENVANTLSNTKIWISSLTPSSDDEVDIALGSAAINSTEQTIANETTAPTGGVTFSRPISKATGLTIGNLTPNSFKSVWIKRSLNPNAAQITNNFYIIAAEGDAPA